MLIMCYDDQARPPIPPGSAGTATGEAIVLTASDGNSFNAYFATPSQPSGAGVLIYPDVRGLHQFYRELALRFAEMGITALALDYFGRTAGLTSRDESFEYGPHVQQIQFDSFSLDVQAALSYLRDKAGANAPVFVVGFCMGGTLTILSGTNAAFGFAGLMPFYAGVARSFAGKGSVLENADQVVYPLLGLFGGADQGIPESAVKELDEKLDTAGIEHNVVIYPGAPHSFFDRRATDYVDASTDAWQRVLAFVSAHNHPVQA
jgi:carboxymethylenebutenolidase